MIVNLNETANLSLVYKKPRSESAKKPSPQKDTPTARGLAGESKLIEVELIETFNLCNGECRYGH